MKCKLEEYVYLQNGKMRPKREGNIPVFGGNGIMAFTNESNMARGVIVGRVGAYCGSVYLSNDRCWVSDNAIKVIPRNNIDLNYLYYLLVSFNLNHQQIGTSQPLLTQNILKNIEVRIPNIEIQKKFSGVLKLLDDMIKLNERINKNLVV